MSTPRAGDRWPGTCDGLVRFDGVTFELFDRSDVPEIRSQVIFRLTDEGTGTSGSAARG